MFEFLKMMSGLLPPDTEDAKAMRTYHRNNSITLTLVVAALVLVILPAMFYTLPKMGGLAWSSEIDHRAEVIAKKTIEPIEKKISDLDEKVEAQGRVQVEQGAILSVLYAATIRDSLCRYVGRRAIQKDYDERKWLLEQIDDLKIKYKQYTGHDFTTDDC